MQVQPYLDFSGRCEEAVEFYKKALGAKVEVLMRFKDSPEPPPPGCPPSDPNKVMHVTMKIGQATVMASDGMMQGKPEFKGISLSLDAEDESHARKLFEGLSEGGKVTMPLTKTFFAKSFGMVADKFGVHWMVIVPAPMPSEK
jgi:PhnB protein